MVPNLPPRYVLGQELGRGGMGVVYDAEDTRLHRKVAIKVLASGPAMSDRKYRFTREAQAASALNHPNIVTVHDIDTTGDGEFIVMEFVDGMPLSELMRAGALSLDRALEYAVQMADALAASHAANIVHRDLKPANVMVTREGRVKVLDFGLSKWMIDANATADKATETAAPRTEAGAILGTVGYMSPEQALGQPVDARSDVFSFGIVLYEILAGRRPFRGDSDWATIDALIHQAPAPLADIRRDIPPSAAQIVQRCLEKDRAMRYPSAVELLTDLRALSPKTTSAHAARTRYAVLAGTAVLLVVTAIGWVAVRRWQSATLVGQAVPEIDRLVDAGQYMAAYRVGMRAERVAPGDPRIKEHLSRATLPMTLAEPAGATVSFKGFNDGAEGWQSLGRVPLKDVLVPIGQLQWKLEKDGFESSEGSSPMTPVITLRPIGEAPPAMVYVRGGLWREGTAVATLPDFWMDRYEVTNREFKRFVDAGGYLNQKYWNVRLDVVEKFRDKTGRPGPAAWELGTFAEGLADYPVSGVSWYEAAAYATFAGKRLPTVFHWRLALGNLLFGQVVAAAANFNGKSVEPVTRLKDLGAFGTYGLGGNVKEWIWNATGDERSVVGGAWTDPPYLASNREVRSPLDRNLTFGFRCVRDTAPLAADALAAIPPRRFEPLGSPVGDQAFTTYKALYRYDRTPLDAKVELTSDQEFWRLERVSIAAAYGRERVPVYLLLPKNASPPYQPVVWFPGGYAIAQLPFVEDFAAAPLAAAFTFVARTGRALIVPIYQGMYQRSSGVREFPTADQMNAYRDMVIGWSKDMGRTIDYLETRPDIDATKLGYYGISAGANAALPVVAVESRFKAVVLLSGGLLNRPRPAEADPLNFASRITAPTLMLNGRDDFVFPLETVARPLFSLLGTPADRKRLSIHDTGHMPALNDLIRDVLGWFDQYLGPVKITP